MEEVERRWEAAEVAFMDQQAREKAFEGSMEEGIPSSESHYICSYSY